MNINRGKIIKPKKIVVYGPEGIGKSTFASQAPEPLFIDTEGSTNELDVMRFDPPTSWTMLKEQVKYVISYPDCCRTLVLDTADWAERMEIDELCKSKGWDGLEGAGYGKGYTYSAEEFGKLLNLLSDVIDKGVNVIITAHAEMKKIELPEEMGSYDHWSMKTSKKVAPMIREWADVILFANYKITVVNVDGQGAQKGKNKAQGGRRVMYTTHTPFWDAKNRYDLPEELPFSFDEIRHILPADETKEGSFPMPEPVSEPAADPGKPSQGKAKPKSTRGSGETVGNKGGEKPSEEKKAAKPSDKNDVKPLPKKEHTPPEIVTDENLDKRIPKKLRDLMIANSIGEWDLNAVVQARLPGAFPLDMAVADYPQDFIDEWLLPNWDKVAAYAREARDNMEIPFN